MNYSRRRSERIGVEKILYEQHLERLKNVEPVTDCYFYGPKIKPIPRYVDETNRFRRRIEKENAHLLTRLAKVKSGTATHHHMSIVRQLRWKQRLLHIERINRLKRIVQQNQRLLRNIQTVKPTIQLPPIHVSPISRQKKRPPFDGIAKHNTHPHKLQEIQQNWENITPIEKYTPQRRVSFDFLRK